MRRPWLTLALLVLGLMSVWIGAVLAQGGDKIMPLLAESYDLLEAGQLDQAKAVFQEILKLEPGNPVALNNLGAVLVKEKKYQEALGYLNQARDRARGYQVRINRVCAVDEVCLAFRPAEPVYGDQELLPLVNLNISMVKARLATRE